MEKMSRFLCIAVVLVAVEVMLPPTVPEATAQQDRFTPGEGEGVERFFTFTNILANGDFELDEDRNGFPDEWMAWNWSPAEESELREAVHKYLGTTSDALIKPRLSELFPFFGKKSLLLTSVDGKTGPGVYTTAEFAPGIYTISLYVKNPGEGRRKLGLFMANGGRLFEVGRRWRNVVHTERIPYNIREGEISIRDWTFSPGELLVDRAVLFRLPFDVRYSTRMDLRDPEATFEIEFTEIENIQMPIGINLEIDTPSGEVVRKNIEGVLEQPSDHVEFELSPREAGLYEIKLEIYDLRTADIIFTDDNIEALYSPPDSSAVEEATTDDRLSLDFFPIGIRVQGHELGDLMGMGFNSVLISNPEIERVSDNSNLWPSMQLRHFYEVSHDADSDSCGDELLEIAALSRNMPGFSGWFVQSDFTAGVASSDSAIDIVDCLTDKDHRSPVVLEKYLPNRKRTTDLSAFSLVALDPNPISDPVRPLYVIGLWADYLAADQKKEIHTIGMPQIFGGWPVASRSPTIVEVRAMTYLSVNHGARGIIYRDFSSLRPYFDEIDSSWDIRKVPDLWKAIPNLNKELTILSPYLMEGPSDEVEIELEKRGFIDYMTWRDEKSIILIAVNVYDGEVEGKFIVGEQILENGAAVLFEERRADAGDGSFSDHFAPFETHVYKFNLLAN